jgi:putative ABC transport system permease protein
MAFVGALLSLYVDLALKPFPGIEDGGQLVTIAEVNGSTAYSFQFGFTERVAEAVTSLEAVVGIGQSQSSNVGRNGETVILEYASRGFFDGIRPKLGLGRGFEPAEHNIDAEPVVVISDRYWRERYDGRRNVLGETIEFIPQQSSEEDLVPTEFRIIGVMAPEMRGLRSDDVDVWVPFERIFAFWNSNAADLAQLLSDQYMHSVGRLKPGASPEALAREIEARFPGEAIQGGSGTRFDAMSGVVLDIPAQRESERQLELFLAGSVLLALVAAANVSLFLLARAPGRRRELAIRMSVGAPMRRLVRQLAIESALLVAVSGALGLLFSVWLAKLLAGMAFLRSANWGNVTLLDWRVLSLIGGFLLVLTLLVALAPILGLRRFGIAASSRQVVARATLAQQIAGTVQIAVAATFSGAAIAFIWFLIPLLFGDPGYDVENRHIAVLFSDSFFDRSPGRAAAEITAANQREVIEALPGVVAATFGDSIPGGQVGGLLKRPVRDPVDSSREIPVGYVQIDAQFVEVLGLQLLYGRAPDEGEIGVSLANEALARLVFGRDDAVGETVEIQGLAQGNTEIVGVLEDVPFGHPAAGVEPALFRNLPSRAFVLRGVIESPLSSGALQQELLRLYESGALELRPNSVIPLADIRESMIAPDRARGLLTISTASLAILMAIFGFYGMQRYLVSAGRREYAIRASLGAGPKALRQLVVTRGLLLGLAGLALGTLLAFLLVAWLRDAFLSREISPGIVAVGVVIGIALLLLAASLGPARQAMRMQPAPLLRED